MTHTLSPGDAIAATPGAFNIWVHLFSNPTVFSVIGFIYADSYTRKLLDKAGYLSIIEQKQTERSLD